MSRAARMQSLPLDDPGGLPDRRSRSANTKSSKKAHGLLGLSDEPSRNKVTKPPLNQTLQSGQYDREVLSGLYVPENRMTRMEENDTGQDGEQRRPRMEFGKGQELRSGFKVSPNHAMAQKLAGGEIAATPPSAGSQTRNTGWKGDLGISQKLPWSTSSQTLDSSLGQDGSMQSLSHNAGNWDGHSSKGRHSPGETTSKQASSATDTQQIPDDDSSNKRSKRLHMSKLFPKAREASSRLSPARFRSSPTEMTDGPSFLPEHTTRAELKRRTGTGRLEVITTNVRNPSLDSGSTGTIRAKVFEEESIDSHKRTVKRPPKGIQNWFDAYDTGSDDLGESEEDTRRADNVTSLADRRKSRTPDLPQESVERIAAELSSAPRDATRTPLAELEQPDSPQNHPVVRNQSQSVQTREQPTTKKLSEMPAGPFDGEPAHGLSTATDRPKHVNQNDQDRVLQSQFALRSVLSLTDSDDDYVEPASASAISLQRPTIPPRKIHNPPSPERIRQAFEMETPSSLPAELVATTPISPQDKRPSSHSTGDRIMNYADHVSGARRFSHSSPRKRHAHRRLTGSSTQTRFDDIRSSVGTTTGSSSVPSGGSRDADRLMAVTEEEMMLLEMMRQRRVLMQQQRNRSPEKYANGMDDALRQLRMSRESAQSAVSLEMEMLRRKERAWLAGGTSSTRRESSQRGSIASSYTSGPVALPEAGDGNRITLSNGHELSYEQIGDFGGSEKERLENAKRIERFLREQSPIDEEFPTSLPEVALLRRSVSASARDSTFSASQFEESFSPMEAKASPFRRLTRRLTDNSPVRDSYATTFEEQQDYEERALKGYLDVQRIVEARRLERLSGLRADRKQSVASAAESDADVDTNDEEEEEGEDGEEETYEVGPEGFPAGDDLYFPSPPSNRVSLATFEDQFRRVGRSSLLRSPVLEEEQFSEERSLDGRSSTARLAHLQRPALVSPMITPAKSPQIGQTLATTNRAPMNSPSLTPPISVVDAGSVRGVSTSADHQSSLPSEVPARAPSPPLSDFTNRPVPLTPQSSGKAPLYDQAAVRGANAKLDDNISHAASDPGMTENSKFQTPTRLQQHIAPEMTPSRSTDSWWDRGRVTSSASVSGDVLAAWAELGGGNDVYNNSPQRQSGGSRQGKNNGTYRRY